MDSKWTPIRTIFHIADIHIRVGNVKYDEDPLDIIKNVNYAFDQLVDDIKKHRPGQCAVVIAGDVFHHKTYTSPHANRCFIENMQKLDQIEILTIIIPGNHDYNGGSSDTIDLISSLLTGKRFKNVHCYPKSGIYSHRNVDFHVLSPIDKIVPPIDEQPPRRNNEHVYRIAIAHDIVKECKHYFASLRKFAPLSVSHLRNYDITMLGDMHKPWQQENIVYPGSFIQQRKGEDINHGVFKWSLKNPIGKQFCVYKPYSVYLTIPIVGTNNLDNADILPDVRARKIAVEYKDTTPYHVVQMINKIEEKYGLRVSTIDDKNKTVVKVTEDLKIGDTIIPKANVNLDTLDNQLTLIEAALKEKNADDETISWILGYHRQQSTMMTKNNTRWSINYVWWSNMYCYGDDNFIDFRSMNGIIPVIGRNQIGKSSILDVITFALYGEDRGAGAHYIANVRKDKARVRCSLQVGGDTYIIDIQSTGKGWSFTITKNGDIADPGSKSSFKTYMQGLIGKVDEFRNVNHCRQNSTLHLQNITDTKAKTSMIKYLGITDMDKLISTTDGNIKELSSQIETLRKSIGQPVTILNTNIQGASKKLIKLNKELSELDRKINELRKEKENILGNLDKQYFTLSHDELVNQITNKKKIIDKMPNVKQVSVDYDELDLEQKMSLLNEEYVSVSGMVERLTGSLKELPSDFTPALQGGDPVNLQKQISNLTMQLTSTDVGDEGPKTEDELKKILKVRKKRLNDLDPKQVIRNDIDNQILPCDITKKKEIPEEEVANINERLEKLYTERQRIIDSRYNVTVAQAKGIRDEIKSIRSKYSEVKFAPECECCLRNKTIIITISGEQRLLDEYNEKKKQLDHNKQLQLTLDNVDKQISVLTEILDKIDQNDAFDHNIKVNQIKKDMSAIEKVNCRLKTIENNKRLVEIERLTKKLDYAKNYDRYLKNIEIKTEIDKYESSKRKIKKKINAYKEGGARNALEKTLREMENALELLDKNRNIQQDIAKLVDVQNDLRQESSNINIEITKLKEQMNQRKQIDEQIEECDKKKSRLSLYLSCIDYKTGVAVKILEYHLDKLENTMNEILKDITDFTIRIDPDGGKKRVENGKIRIKFMINKLVKGDQNTLTDVKLPLMSGSGFQAIIAELAWRIALIKMNDGYPRFILIDEAFASMDEENLENTKEVLKKLVHRRVKGDGHLDFIMIISHIESLQTIQQDDSKIIRITMKNNDSHACFGTPIPIPPFIKVSTGPSKPPAEKQKNDYNQFDTQLKELKDADYSLYKNPWVNLTDNDDVKDKHGKAVAIVDGKTWFCTLCQKTYKGKGIHIKNSTHIKLLIAKGIEDGVIL